MLASWEIYWDKHPALTVSVALCLCSGKDCYQHVHCSRTEESAVNKYDGVQLAKNPRSEFD